MLLRIAFILLFSAFTVLLSVDLLLWLTLSSLTGFLTFLGIALLLTAFSMLLLPGLWLVFKQIYISSKPYFSAKLRYQRHLLFKQNRHRQLQALFAHRKIRLDYVQKFKRKQVLQRNNRKHIYALARAIDKELRALKKTLPENTFKVLKQENHRYCKQLNSTALLQLQQKITNIHCS